MIYKGKLEILETNVLEPFYYLNLGRTCFHGANPVGCSYMLYSDMVCGVPARTNCS